MIFVSSTVPLNKIHASKEEIYKMDWFLFSATIGNKDYLKDNNHDCLKPILIYY